MLFRSIGSLQLFPGGTLTGTFVTDMARSKARLFTGSFAVSNSKDVSFHSDAADVPLANLNGTITRSVVTDKRRPPVEYLLITTATAACMNQVYKLALTTSEED